MRWLVMLAMVICLLVAGNAQAVNLWAMYEDTSFITRLGTDIGDSFEVGAELQSSMDWDYPFTGTDYLGGIYGIAKVGDRNAFINPYVGGRILTTFESDFDAVIGGPVVGVLIKEVVVIEGRNQYWSSNMDCWKPDEWVFSAGVTLRF